MIHFKLSFSNGFGHCQAKFNNFLFFFFYIIIPYLNGIIERFCSRKELLFSLYSGFLSPFFVAFCVPFFFPKFIAFLISFLFDYFRFIKGVLKLLLCLFFSSFQHFFFQIFNFFQLFLLFQPKFFFFLIHNFLGYFFSLLRLFYLGHFVFLKVIIRRSCLLFFNQGNLGNNYFRSY